MIKFVLFRNIKKGFSFFFFLHLRDKTLNDKKRSGKDTCFLKTVVNPAYTIDKISYIDM